MKTGNSPVRKRRADSVADQIRWGSEDPGLKRIGKRRSRRRRVGGRQGRPEVNWRADLETIAQIAGADADAAVARKVGQPVARAEHRVRSELIFEAQARHEILLEGKGLVA